MAALALQNLKVLDLSRLFPGALCTQVLADLGADVIKVEAPPRGDYLRDRAPFHESQERTTSSVPFIGLNRNKRSILLDLKHPEGPETFLRLVSQCDVVLESFRPGVLDRLSVGFEALREVNPRVILCSITGWGRSGPKVHDAGHDINYLAEVGLLSTTGSTSDPPMIPSFQAADAAGALFAVISILAAIHERSRSGMGQHLDVPMAFAALSLASMSVANTLVTGVSVRRDEGLLTGGVVCYQTYRCKDGWVALGALEEKFWSTWCIGVDRTDLVECRHAPTGSAVHRDVAGVFLARTKEQWREFGSNHDCCLSVVSGLDEALKSDVVEESGILHSAVQPGATNPFMTLGQPFSMSRTPPDGNRFPAPPLGAHTREVLLSSGMTFVEVDRLIEAGLAGLTGGQP